MEKDYLYAFFAEKTFVKIKPAFDIGKVLFSFVDRQNNFHIDCYVELLDFEELLSSIKSRYLQRQLDAERSKGEKYPQSVWDSPLGGTTNNGKTFSRKFGIAPGTKMYAFFKAETGPANEVDKKIMPVKRTEQNKDQFKQIFVGVADYRDLIKMEMKCSRYLSIWYDKIGTKNLATELDLMLEENRKYKSNSGDHDRGSNNDQSSDSCNNAEPENKETGNGNESQTSTSIQKALFKSKNKMQDMKNGGKYLYACRKDDQSPIPVVFLEEYIQKTDSRVWNSFMERVMMKDDVPFTIFYTETKGKLFFHSFVS